MKKMIILFLTGIVLLPSLFSQSCVNDVWMSLRNDKIAMAKKDVDACIASNPNSADAWLIRGTVYMRRYQQELDLQKKNSSYVIKDPDAIWIANESFYKALTLNTSVEPKTGMVGAREGQILCADPIYYMGIDQMNAGNYDKAVEYLNIAARNYRLDEKNPNLPIYLGEIYVSLAQIALDQDDMATCKKMLQEGVNAKTPILNIYLTLYDIYKNEKDTVNAGKVLNSARRNVPADLAMDVYGYELDFYAMIGDAEKLNATCDSIIKNMGETPPILALIATYLNNSGQYEKAEEYIKQGLEKEPDNFDLNQQMGYRYFYEALVYQDRITEAMDAMQFTKMTELQAEEKVVLGNAHTWVEKAYNINKEDRQNNIMLFQLKMRLQKEIPAELKEKNESYKQ